MDPADRSLANEDQYELFEINMSLHGLIYTHSKKVPNPHLIVRTQQMHVDADGEWCAWDNDGGGKKKSTRRRR